MTITIEIETDNAAFKGGNKGTEICRILRTAIAHLRVSTRADAWPVSDVNGNTVGTVTVSGK